MGTNYYLETTDTPFQRYHIGKSSYGWEFLFRAQPELEVYSSSQWIRLLQDKVQSTIILDEYNEKITFDEFIRIIDPKRLDQYNSEKEDNKKAQLLQNHFDYLRVQEFESFRNLIRERGLPFNSKLEDMQPTNCWKDLNGYAVCLGEFS